MKTKDLIIYIQLKSDILRKDVIPETRNLINSTFKFNKKYLKIHESSKEKLNYVFSYISEKGNVFYKDKVYSFSVRSKDIKFLKDLRENLQKLENNNLNYTKFKYITSSISIKSYENVTSVRLKTPIQLQEELYSKKNLMATDYFKILPRLNETSVFKYNKATNSNLDVDKTIVFKNIVIKKPVIKLYDKYKGNYYQKVGFISEFEVSLNEDAQKVLEFCLNSGIGRGSTFMGTGFLEVKKGGC